MRISKLLSVIVFAGLAVAAASASADPSPNPTPPKISCKAGKLVATSAGGWRVNGAATWKWDQAPGVAASFQNCDKDNHCDSATFVGGKSCTGNVTVYVCTSSNCSPPFKVPVTGS
jgi:hypothetical protein